MGGGRGLKQGKKAVGGMELIEKQVENLTQNHENPVSGAHIRSLVNQLSSSSPPPPPPPSPPPRKKQARRRLHTTRPYQERLLNMAEARREIVTALKFHRAAKKQHRQQEQEQEQPEEEEEKDRLVLPLPPPRPRRPSEQEPNLCSSWANGFSDIAPAGFRSPCLFFPPPPPPPALFQESLNFPLPNQTLGLNLNFQGFDHLDASPYLPSCNNPSIYASSPSSSSSNYCSVSSGLQHHHPSLGEREISEMKSMGEKHQMEWNDSMNLATSALWLEFLETMGEEKRGGEEDDGYGCYHPFDEAMEFPVWLNAGDESCLEHNLNVNFSDDFCFQNPALPCIEEIQGNEVEWLTGED